MAAYRLIVDHIGGYRRGQRDLLPIEGPLRFGRHPDSDIVFHANRDIDASAQHAALRDGDDGFVLVDLGSSNGTFVNGSSVDRHVLPVGEPVEVVFGDGGPRCRLLILAEDQEEPEFPGGPGNAGAVRGTVIQAVGGGAKRLYLIVALTLLGLTAVAIALAK